MFVLEGWTDSTIHTHYHPLMLFKFVQKKTTQSDCVVDWSIVNNRCLELTGCDLVPHE